MRHRIAAVLFISALTVLPDSGWAGPLIIAKKLEAKCAGQPGMSGVTTVSVTLDPVTHNFYGTQLYYHFTPNPNGTAATLASPTDNPNPVPQFVTPGWYKLVVTNQAAPGGSASPEYVITVASDAYSIMGNRKMCKVSAPVAPKPHLPLGLLQKKPQFAVAVLARTRDFMVLVR